MSAAVDNPILLPAPQAQALAEVEDSDGVSGGLRRVGISLNSLYEQKRGQLIADSDPTGIITSTGEIARYRCKVLGGSGLTDEYAKVFFEFSCTEGPPPIGSNVTIRLTQGAATSTVIQTVTQARQWVQAPDILLDDTEQEYINFELEVTVLTNMSVVLYSVSVFYEREKATLTAQIGGYDNGAIPIEEDQLDGERPVSTVRLHHMHHLAEHLYNRRVGQIISTHYRVALTTANGTIFAAEVPAGVEMIRLWLYILNSSGRVDITWNEGSIVDTTLAGGWNGPYELDVTPQTEQTIRIFGETATIKDLSGWLVDAEY